MTSTKTTTTQIVPVRDRIYFLTGILKHLQRRHTTSFRERETGSNLDSPAPLTKRLNHVAVLLTRGSREETVLAGIPTTDEVTCITASTESLSPSLSNESTKALSEMCISRNSESAGKSQDIGASITFEVGGAEDAQTLEQLLSDCNFDQFAKKIPFSPYMLSAVRVLRWLAQAPDDQIRSKRLDAALVYFTRQCCSKIAYRVRIAYKICFQILEDWKPLLQPNFPLAVHDIMLKAFLREFQVPESNTEQNVFLFEGTRWLVVIFDALKSMLDHLREIRDSQEDREDLLIDVSGVGECLYRYLKILPQDVWSSSSLVALLTKLFNEGIVDDDELAESESALYASDADGKGDAYIPRPCFIFKRLVLGATSISTALFYLSKQSFLKSTKSFKIINIDLPNDPTSLLAESRIQKLLAAWQLTPDQEETIEDALKQFLETSEDPLSGACCCEAGVMALLTMAKERHDVCPTVLQSLHDNYTGEIAIGVAKKCCPLCHMLQEVVNEQAHLPVIRLPASHATYSSWVPPAWLSSDILDKLERKVLQDLKRVLGD